ncbi:MAG: HAMP domain-containing histidine kinase [Planctomycetes bacterium]|nr:HAMP domain-containing histidine kinase [Planctomycetota bacterium]
MRRPSSILFASTLLLSIALVVWWTIFQVVASNELAAAGARLVAGDGDGAAAALGADDAVGLADLARRRRAMFASEGAFFGVVLLGLGWLYAASVRREAELRTNQDRFLAAATHELKTPLATIVLLLESLRGDRLPADKRARYLDNGLREAERLEHGLDNVLTAAGLRTARRRLQPQPGDLVVDTRDAIEALRPRALAADIELRLSAPAELAAMRDGAAVQVVLRNLLDNAIKYSPPGSAVTTTVRTVGEHAEVAVQDHGRGLDAAEHSHAFEAFWRGSDSASGGTGLGLHLVHQLVQAHGGFVTAHSDGRDRGSVFTVRLPLSARAGKERS